MLILQPQPISPFVTVTPVHINVATRFACADAFAFCLLHAWLALRMLPCASRGSHAALRVALCAVSRVKSCDARHPSLHGASRFHSVFLASLVILQRCDAVWPGDAAAAGQESRERVVGVRRAHGALWVRTWRHVVVVSRRWLFGWAVWAANLCSVRSCSSRHAALMLSRMPHRHVSPRILLASQ